MLAACLSILFALGVPVEAVPAAETLTPPRAAFARFKRLEGRWKGESTKGWKEDVAFRAIAGGSPVVETSINAHPDETMLTLFAMDGEQLRLTHYCVAKNQPRLEATSFEDGGTTVSFAFVDGGNLASRDQGHVDGRDPPDAKAVTTEDRELVAVFVANADEASFRRLYAAHTPRLYLSLLRLCGGFPRISCESSLRGRRLKTGSSRPYATAA